MAEFSKTCPACKKNFKGLKEFMDHIKTEHEDISPGDLLDMGKEHKWKFRQ